MTYLIIGNMTGNSMDAIDLVLTEFSGKYMRDICVYTKPYDKAMQKDMEYLRQAVYGKTAEEIYLIPRFREIHDIYIKQIADCINDMLFQNGIDKSCIDAIGFHGKTLDHYPPSRAKSKDEAYTLQVGSGKMLADLTNIPVVYDFRSAFLMAGLDGAPLVCPHNAHIAFTEGDGCYYNGGNTSNFTLVIGGKILSGSDAGPFNEYTDNFIRQYTDYSYDKDGMYGLKGELNISLLQKLYNAGRIFYETSLPKSGDPQYYYSDKIFDMIENEYPFKIGDKMFCDIVHTLEYFSAYIAVHALTHLQKDIIFPENFILFGGGWKNPVVKKSFTDLVEKKGFILAEHEAIFKSFYAHFNKTPKVQYSKFGEYMEARLFADLARYRLDNTAWEIPEAIEAGKHIVCGIIAKPKQNRKYYTDMCNLAAKGWQNRQLES